MAITFERVAIIGATGPTGRALARELVRRGVAVRAISRTMGRLVSAFPYDPIDRRAADARDVMALSGALAGCDAAVDCIGLPAHQMRDHATTARTIAAVLKARGASIRAVHVSSTWSYMPITALPLGEDHPRRGGPPWAVARREAEDALRDAGAAIIHLPDFFGPHCHTGPLQLALADLMRGRPMNWIGGPDVERDHIYVPDAMAAAADLMVREEAYGEDWIVPGSGAISARRIAGMASHALARQVPLRSVGLPTLRLAALVNRELRGFLQMVPEYMKPVAHDGSKLARLIGGRERTSYKKAIGKTLDWLRDG